MTDTTDVPGKYDCAFEGVGFMMDDKHDAFKSGIDTIPLLRSQADSSDEPGEASTNPEDLWPRSQHSFNKGSGQQWLDTDNGDRLRYSTSRGLDPWTRGRIETLEGTNVQYVSTNGNFRALAATSSYMYAMDADQLVFWTDTDVVTDPAMPAPTNANIYAGEGSSGNLLDFCTDGNTVYVATQHGIHKTVISSTSATHYNNLQADRLGFCKGRLMASVGPILYNVTGTDAPTYSFTHPSSDFAWECFSNGQSAIYAAGNSGIMGQIYYITVKDDGTGLNVPQVAAELPDGEYVRSMAYYLGFMCIGTTNGFRLATTNSDNTLTIGALIPLTYAVECFEPQARFVWFGWTNFDDSFTGLGRMDLGQDVEQNVPAYASDIMYGSTVGGFGQQGRVTSVITMAERRLFSVAGKGLIRENTAGSGVLGAYVETSEITFGVPDNKVALELAIEHEPLSSYGVVRAYIKVDNGSYTLVGTSDTPGSRHPDESFKFNVTGSVFQLKFQMSTEAAIDYAPTALNRYTLRAYPIPTRGRSITVPLLLHEHYKDTNETSCSLKVEEAWDYMQNLASLGQRVRYQELDKSYDVFIDELQFQRYARTQDGKAWQGTLACKLKVLGE